MTSNNDTPKGLSEAPAATFTYPETGLPGSDVDRIPSIPVFHEAPNHHLTFSVGDNAFSPMILEGDTVVVNPAESWLNDGDFYAVRREGEVRLWLPSSAGHYCDGDEDKEVQLLSLTEPFRWTGILKRKDINVVGRVVGLLDPERPTTPEGDPVLPHAAEWEWVKERFTTFSLIKWRFCKLLPEHLQDEALRGMSQDQRHVAKRDREAEAEKIGLGDITRRKAAVGERIFLMQDRIHDTEPTTSAGALAKLVLFWDIHCKEDKEEARDWGDDLLANAIKVLGGEAYYMPYTEEAVRARFGHLDPEGGTS